MNATAKVQDEMMRSWLGAGHQIDIAMMPLRCPEGETPVANLSGGEKKKTGLVPAAFCRSRISCSRRADNHWMQRVCCAGTTSSAIQRTLLPSHTIVISWIMCRVDSGAGPREGIPWKGNYSSWLEQKSNACQQERKKQESKRQKTLQRELDG